MITGKINMEILVVGTEDGKSTYEVRRKWKEKGKKALVIELYPTITVENCGKMDVSTMHLLNHAEDFRWSELRIVNLYSTVITGKPRLAELKEDSLPYIEEILEEEDIKSYDIVIAWGNSLVKHQPTINIKMDFLTMLEEKGLSNNAKCISVSGMDKKKNLGTHPLYLGLHYSKDNWCLSQYPVKEVKNTLKKSISQEKNLKKVEKKNTESQKKESMR
ncbi:DUF1643 domain-containing protein [Sellimonas intestinalis]|uniref:DUF1643 domain-containing protein n=1 Tax=Sellimonas intestinalis TaxID=1653434 RepID=UPI003AB8EBB4